MTLAWFARCSEQLLVSLPAEGPRATAEEERWPEREESERASRNKDDDAVVPEYPGPQADEVSSETHAGGQSLKKDTQPRPHGGFRLLAKG